MAGKKATKAVAKGVPRTPIRTRNQTQKERAAKKVVLTARMKAAKKMISTLVNSGTATNVALPKRTGEKKKAVVSRKKTSGRKTKTIAPQIEPEVIDVLSTTDNSDSDSDVEVITEKPATSTGQSMNRFPSAAKKASTQKTTWYRGGRIATPPRRLSKEDQTVEETRARASGSPESVSTLGVGSNEVTIDFGDDFGKDPSLISKGLNLIKARNESTLKAYEKGGPGLENFYRAERERIELLVKQGRNMERCGAETVFTGN